MYNVIMLTVENWTHNVSVNKKDDHADTKFKVFKRPISVTADVVVNAS